MSTALLSAPSYGAPVSVPEPKTCEEWDYLFPASPCPFATPAVPVQEQSLDPLIPDTTDALVHLLSAMGLPGVVIIVGLTIYVIYGWYASGRWALRSARLVGGMVANALQRGGLSVLLSALRFGLWQLVFLLTSILLGQFLLLIIGQERGTVGSFTSSNQIDAMTQAILATSYADTQGVIVTVVILTFLPLVGAFLGNWIRWLFAAVIAIPFVVIAIIAALSTGTLLLGLFPVFFGGASWGIDMQILLINTVVTIFWTVSAIALFVLGKPIKVIPS